MSTRDEKTGEDIRTVELEGLTVIAKSKQVPERNGKIALDFIVRVPSAMINDKWQLQLTPKLYLPTDTIELEKLFLSGAEFLRYDRTGKTLSLRCRVSEDATGGNRKISEFPEYHRSGFDVSGEVLQRTRLSASSSGLG